MRMTNQEEQEPVQEAARGPAAPAPAVNAVDPIDMALQSRALAIRHYNAGQVAKGQAICREILALKPNYMDSLQLLGVIAQDAGCHHAAKDMFRKAIARDNGIPECNLNIGPAYSVLDRLENCVGHFGEAIRLGSN
jgi:tetratricopeptide (TPR) repeat protein